MKNKIKNKPKFNLSGKISMTDKEKKLVLILLMVVTVYISKTFLFDSKIEELMDSVNRYKSISEKHKYLKEQNENIGSLKKQASALEYKYNKMIREVPPYLSESETMLIMGNTATESGIRINAISVDGIERIEKSKYFTSKGTQQGESSEDKKDNEQSNSNSNESKDENAEQNIKGSKVIITKMSIGYEGEYSAIYKFIKKLEENERKILVDEVSMNINEGNNLKGNLKLKLLSYTDENVEIKEDLKFPQINGKFDLFSVDGKKVEGYTKSYYTPNMLLEIKNYNYNGPKYIFSEYGKTESEIYSNAQGNIEGKLRIEKLESKYRIIYSLGNVSKVIEREFKIKDNTVRIDVLSHKRVNIEDNMNIKLDVENKTAGAIEITVANDDLDKPIFTLKKDAKDVALKRVSR